MLRSRSLIDLFLASIATCAGIYVKGFCDSRGIPSEGLGMTMEIERDPATHRVSRLVRPGGYVVVGLYNTYSRLLHYARRALVRRAPWTGRWLDPHFGRVASAGKSEAWFQDQYLHPHETCHTLDEVLRWMDDSGLDFVNSIPKPAHGPVLSAGERLFAPRTWFRTSCRIGCVSTVASARCTADCEVWSACTTTTIWPMCVASTRDSVVSSSGGESKMMMRSL